MGVVLITLAALVRFVSLPSLIETSALRRFVVFIVLLWALDLGIKWAVTQQFNYAERLNIMPFFDLILVHNKGAAFSFLASQPGWQRWFFSHCVRHQSLANLVVKAHAKYSDPARAKLKFGISGCSRQFG